MIASIEAAAQMLIQTWWLDLRSCFSPVCPTTAQGVYMVDLS